MTTQTEANFVVFSNAAIVAKGPIHDIIAEAKTHRANNPENIMLIFEEDTGSEFQVDLNGPLDLILKTLPTREPDSPEPVEEEIVAQKPTRPGRPKLGVTSKEVTLLPRHWEWLKQQKGGASVTLRKLVEIAKRTSAIHEKTRLAQDACNRFIVAIAGDLPKYEDATRALYSADYDAFRETIKPWPEDIKAFALKLLTPAMNEKKTMTSTLDWRVSSE